MPSRRHPGRGRRSAHRSGVFGTYRRTVTQDTKPTPSPQDGDRQAGPDRFTRGDLVSVVAAAGLVAAAIVLPLVADPRWRSQLYAGAGPLFGEWLPHWGFGTVPAIGVAALVVSYGPQAAQLIRWRWLVLGAWAASAAWTMSLALVDGWHRGFTDRLTDDNEYLHEVAGVSDIATMLREFSSRILDFQPDRWTTHVAGHPPGALLTYVGLDRVGLSGGAWAAALSALAGSSAVAAVLITLRALSGETTARTAAPFLVLAPTAIWVAVSADGYFMGVTTWGIALLALATRTRGPRGLVLAFAAGAQLGFAVYLSYGLMLMGPIAVAVLVAGRTVRPLLPAVLGALAVAAAFTAAGFWWFEGLSLVTQRYYQGIASERHFSYWGWANIAATICVVGFAVAAGLHRALRPARVRQFDGLTLLVIAAVMAIAAADLSALSKAETERIWLPFTVWLLPAASLLPRPQHRHWLVLQAAAALLINHLILTRW